LYIPSVVTRLVPPAYSVRQCGLQFPPEDGHVAGIFKGHSANALNKRTKGWFLTNTERVLWVNGQWDPWRDATVSSEYRPGGPLKSTKKAPVFLIPGGIHCNDLLLRNGQANEGVQKVIDAEIEIMKGWVEEYYHK
jgi:hypothetical protein